jgi:FHS family L-fucose permease-like MFS transporter
MPIVTACEVGAGEHRSHKAAMAMVTTLFFAWGFLTVLNDILVPHLKAIFTLNYARVMFIQFSFFVAYFVMALPSGKIINRIGYKRSMILGLVTMGTGALLFVPAASLPSYPLFLAALFVLASGMTILQVSANPYVTVLGPPEGASSRLNLAQAFNSLGTTLAPWIGGMLIFTAGARSASSIKLPYLVFAGTLFVLAGVVGQFRLPVLSAIESHGALPVVGGRTLHSAWQARHLMLGAGAIFLYCGAEVAIGSFLVSFFTQPDIAGLTQRNASHYVSYYWSGAMIGRFAGAALLSRIPAHKVLAGCAMIASALVWLTVLSTGYTALWAIITVGLFNSIMFPNIFALAIDGLGSLTSQASSILIMACLGPAVIPVIQGLLSDRIGVHTAFILPALCYLYVIFYGMKGWRHQDA